MKATLNGACAARVMTISPAVAAISVGLALAGCQKAQEAVAPPPAADAHAAYSSVLVIASSPGGDPLAAARDPATATPAQTQAAEDSRDNARAQAAARQLVGHADWLARQDAICGPGNAAMEARYADRQGPPDAELRDLKVACMAKDIARQATNDALTRHGGVNDTGSL